MTTTKTTTTIKTTKTTTITKTTIMTTTTTTTTTKMMWISIYKRAFYDNMARTNATTTTTTTTTKRPKCPSSSGILTNQLRIWYRTQNRGFGRQKMTIWPYKWLFFGPILRGECFWDQMPIFWKLIPLFYTLNRFLNLFHWLPEKKNLLLSKNGLSTLNMFFS